MRTGVDRKAAPNGARPLAKSRRAAAKKARPVPRAAPSVDDKRAHRRSLSATAGKRWSELGEGSRQDYMRGVRQALMAAGFKASRLQWRHKGHAFGLIRDEGDMQTHVRVYDDGVIDAEIEIHKRYMQHIWSPRPSAHEQVQRILGKQGIATDLVNEQYLPQVGAMRQRFPERRTRVSTVAGSAAAIVGGLVVASIARIVVRRRLR